MQHGTNCYSDSPGAISRDTALIDPDQLLTLKQAAALTGLQISTWRQWIYLGKVTSVRLGSKAVRVFRRDVTEMIAAGIRPARHELTK